MLGNDRHTAHTSHLCVHIYTLEYAYYVLYLPIRPTMCITYNTQYTEGEEVVLWMNTVGPYHNRQETYPYYSLPFCRGSKKEIGHYHETMGEALQGVELEFSGLEIGFKGEMVQFTDS